MRAHRGGGGRARGRCGGPVACDHVPARPQNVYFTRFLVCARTGAAAAEAGAREAVVEGLSRVIASLPAAGAPAAAAAALDLTRPPLQRLQQLLAGGAPRSYCTI